MLRTSLLSALTFFTLSCQKHNEDLSSWKGSYAYNEEPLASLDSISGTMMWQLDLQGSAPGDTNTLEINGPQRSIQLKCSIAGNDSILHILYQRPISGNKMGLKPGDTLFYLSLSEIGYLTVWKKLQPRLRKDSPGICACFRRR